ncbi:hypothetical protein T01_11343 [Trichinella spiralis]|uniref:Transmembrane protein n=1 Tax=Trichinella spiralis TaxID=6334 RepID=A0A0V1BQY0_TRISP|nr:hypothetical protein T01_11343 [Trichinella spiralis]
MITVGRAGRRFPVAAEQRGTFYFLRSNVTFVIFQTIFIYINYYHIGGFTSVSVRLEGKSTAQTAQSQQRRVEWNALVMQATADHEWQPEIRASSWIGSQKMRHLHRRSNGHVRAPASVARRRTARQAARATASATSAYCRLEILFVVDYLFFVAVVVVGLMPCSVVHGD